MTTIEILQWVGAAVAGGILTKISDPIIAIITARGQKKKIEAEANKVEIDASNTPFQQATWIITNLRDRVVALELSRDKEQTEREQLLSELAECRQDKAILMEKLNRIEGKMGLASS
jgi:hypothetical protein